MSEAANLLDQFSESDWAQLKNAIPLRPKLWLVACAEVLGDAPPSHAAAFLMDMVRTTDHDDVKVTALDALRSLAPGEFDFHSVASELRAVIAELRPRAGVVDTIVLDLVEQRLG